MKTSIKSAIGNVLLKTGLWEQNLRRWAQRGEAIILVYHRVLEKWDRTLDYSQPGLVVTAETFDRQLTFFRKYFHIVSLSSLVNPTLDPRPSTLRPSCALTFDDGWRDNYEVAFPILRKHGVQATIFLTTDFIGTSRRFWHTCLMYALLHGDLSNGIQIARVLQAYPAVVRHRVINLVSKTEAPSAQDVDPIIEAVKGMCDEETIEDLIRDLAYACGVRRPLLPDRSFFLDWEQVREMAGAGIEIGSHGRSHRILTRLKGRQAEDEVVRSKTEIEQRVGGKVRHFAFPDGAASHSLIKLVGKAGYESVSVLAAAPGQAQVGPLVLPRVGMHEGISEGVNGSFSQGSLLFWLMRAPRTRVECT